MAKEKKTIEVKANYYVRYDFDSYAIGEVFKIRKSDLESLTQKGYITYLGNDESKNNGEVE